MATSLKELEKEIRIEKVHTNNFIWFRPKLIKKKLTQAKYIAERAK